MIDSLEFVNENGFEIELNTDLIPFEKFETNVSTRTEDIDRQQEHGVWPTFTYLGRRIFVGEGHINAIDDLEYWQTRMDILRALMPYPESGKRRVGKLRLGLAGLPEIVESDVTIESYPEIPIQALYPSSSAFQVIWKAFDPRLYGATERTETIEYIIETPVGRTYNKTYDRTYSAGAIGGSDTLINSAGNVETYPIVTIYGPAVDPQIIRTDTNRAVKLIGLSLSMGQYVILDFKQRSALLMGAESVYNKTIGSSWFTLSPGATPIKFAAFSASSPARAEFSWRNAYMI